MYFIILTTASSAAPGGSARPFYAVIAAAMALGLGIGYLKLDAVKMRRADLGLAHIRDHSGSRGGSIST
jgi:hypothetical protein